jgi:hypothetical protein
VLERLPHRLAELRQRALGSGLHRRTPEIVSNLAIGWTLFLSFAQTVGALTEGEARELDARAWRALGGAAAAQAEHQSGNDPAVRFLELVRAAIAGGLAHVSGVRGDEYMGEHQPLAWGWQERGEDGRSWWQSCGPCVGWVEGNDLYLEPDTAFAVAQRIGHDHGEGLSIAGRTLHKRLAERGLLATTDQSRGRLTVRRTIAGQRRTLLHLAVPVFLAPEPAQSSQSSHRAEGSDESDSEVADDGPDGWASTPAHFEDSAHSSVPPMGGPEPTSGMAGPNGTIGPVPDVREATGTGVGGAGVGEARADVVNGDQRHASDVAEALRADTVALAAQRGWPRLELRPGVAIIAGAEAWQRFLRQASGDDLRVVHGSLSVYGVA